MGELLRLRRVVDGVVEQDLLVPLVDGEHPESPRGADRDGGDHGEPRTIECGTRAHRASILTAGLPDRVASAAVSARPPLGYEPGLDGIRAISIAGVVLFHACATSGLNGWFRGGGLGVSVFFTLSGFLITTLLVRDIDVRGGVDLSRFWGRRIRRLAPASLAAVVAVVVVSRTDWLDVHRGGAVAAVWSATNWHVIASGDAQLLRTIVGALGPTWSLAVEEQFYVALAVIAWLAARTARPARNLGIVFAAVVPISIVLANVVSDWSPRLEFGTDVRAAELAIGGLLALAWRRWHEVLSRAVVARVADAVGIASVGGLVVLFLTADYTPPWLLRGGFSAVAVVTACLIVGVLAHGLLAAALSAPPFVGLGRISYSLYLVHWPVILVMTAGRTGLDGWVLVVAKAAVAIVAAVVLHLAVEQPIRARTDLSTRTTVAGWLIASVAVTVLGLALGAA